MNPAPENITLGGFPILPTSASALVEKLSSTLNSTTQITLFFANTNFIVQCQPLRKKMLDASTLIVNDGVGVDLATWLIHQKKFPENLNGTDLIPHFLKSSNRKARVFLLGAKPKIALRAAKTLSDDFGVTVVGCADGYEQSRNTASLIEAINNSHANILLVAMGNPNQEQWITQHRHAITANILIGVGALFDFLAGDKPRAPRIFQKLRLEWLYRLVLEPSRLMKRYTVDIVIFLSICFRTRNLSLTD